MPATCPTCGETLDIPPEHASRAVRCGACRNVFTPSTEAPSAADAVPDSEPTHRSTFGVWVLAFLTFALTAPMVAGCLWFTVALTFPEFETTADPDGRFTAAFPGEANPVNRNAADGTPIRGLELNRELPPEKYFVYYTDLEAEVGKSQKAQDAAFDHAIDRMVRDGMLAESQVSQRQATTHDGYTATDVILQDPDRTGEQGIVRLILVGKRVYAIGVGGPVNPHDPRVREFFLRFQITGEGPKKNPFIGK